MRATASMRLRVSAATCRFPLSAAETVLIDTPATRAEIDELFGHEIGVLVEGLTKLKKLLTPLRIDDSPFNQRLTGPDARGVTFVEPTLVGEVRYGEWTSDGRLRHPSWRGLRPDKSPEEVIRE